MCYGRKCNVIDRIKIRNKTSIWHELLSYLQSNNSVLKVYKIECGPDVNNDCTIVDVHKNFVIKRKLKAVIRANECHLQNSDFSKNLCTTILDDPNYIIEMIENYPLRLLTFLKVELNHYSRSLNIPYCTPLSRYLERYNIVEMYLDSILKSGDDSKLPPEIFYCKNIKILSLKHNFLRQIPTAIGRLTKLEVLILTDNLLSVQSIPFSLTFCKNLKELYVDDNQLEALPGFLTSMNHLELVYRLGNRNFFKSFFLWYHANFDHRVRKEIWKNNWIRGETGSRPAIPSLLDLSVEKMFSTGINFFEEEIPESLKNYMSLTYLNYNICNFCNIATDCTIPGYTTVTFLTPYLGNTCVPFQHWACSKECVLAIEGPAKKLQIEGAKRLDYEYSHYIANSKKTDDKVSKTKKKRDLCTIS